MVKNAMDKVREWHKKAGVPYYDSINMENYHKRKELRKKLILEECAEFVEAQQEDDIIGIADAFADLIYVICGASLEYGIPLADVFDEVQRSNMTKFSEGIIKREDGKIMKGKGFEPPNLKKIIYKDDNRG